MVLRMLFCIGTPGLEEIKTLQYRIQQMSGRGLVTVDYSRQSEAMMYPIPSPSWKLAIARLQEQKGRGKTPRSCTKTGLHPMPRYCASSGLANIALYLLINV
jgi:hypothetical protein